MCGSVLPSRDSRELQYHVLLWQWAEGKTLELNSCWKAVNTQLALCLWTVGNVCIITLSVFDRKTQTPPLSRACQPSWEYLLTSRPHYKKRSVFSLITSLCVSKTAPLFVVISTSDKTGFNQSFHCGSVPPAASCCLWHEFKTSTSKDLLRFNWRIWSVHPSKVQSIIFECFLTVFCGINQH